MSIDIQIRDNHLHVNGVNYFRGHAEEVTLGAVGRKSTPSTQTNYLEVQGEVVRKGLKIHEATRFSVKGMSVASADIGATLQIPGAGSMSAGTVAAALKSDELNLLKLSVLPKDLIAQVNDNPTKALNPLIACGNRGRIVTQVFIVLAAKTAVSLASATRFEVTAEGSSWSLLGTGGVAGSTGVKVTVSPGSTFAYLLHEPEWNAAQQKNWTRAEVGKDDQWSLY